MRTPKSTPHHREAPKGFADGVGLDDGSFRAPALVIDAEPEVAPAIRPVPVYAMAMGAVAVGAVVTAVTVSAPFMKAFEFVRLAIVGGAPHTETVSTEDVIAVREVAARETGYRQASDVHASTE